MFRISQLIGQNSVDCNFFARDKKKSTTDPGQKKNLNQIRTVSVFIYIRYINLSVPIFGYFQSSLFIYVKYDCALTSQTKHISAVSKHAATSRPKIE